MPSTSLPPHLERFVRQQIAAGRYHSKDEVIRAALRLLEESFLSRTPSAPLSERTTSDWSRRLARPAAGERWETPGEWLAGSPAKETAPNPPRRSPRGLLADLPSGISYDDVREARGELWAGFHPGEV